jgi:hypothetical protein
LEDEEREVRRVSPASLSFLSAKRTRQTQPPRRKRPGSQGTRCDCAKQSQTWAPWGIWGTRRRPQGKCAKQTQLCETNPIWPLRHPQLGDFCAKQSQFGPAGGQPGLLGGENVQNKANFCPSGRRETRAVALCAKQTQFAPRAQEWARAAETGKLPQGRLCQTNPIPAGRARKTIVKARGLGDATPQGSSCAKQTQFLPLCRSGHRRAREGRSCKTNPISGRAGGASAPLLLK